MAPRPWWDRALDPLRYEGAMFRVLLGVVALCALVVLVSVVLRAL
jgi:hypothetical protein